MTHAIHTTAKLLLVAASALATIAARPAEAAPPAGGFLPDTAVIARVNDRVIRVRDYVERYFNSYAEFRPRPDEAGRAEFLKTMIDKEIIASVARSVKRAETFQDRAKMTEYVQRVLANRLFERSIKDSIQVSDAEAESVYRQMRRELRLARIPFASRDNAERTRRQILEGRLSWARAWELRTRLPGDTARTADIGWRSRASAPPAIAGVLFALPVGAISPAIQEPAGWALYQARDEREFRIQEFAIFRGAIMDELLQEKAAQARERLMGSLRAGADLHFDSANVAWAAARFPSKVSGGSAGVVLDVSTPTFAPEDTGRVLATFRGGRITLAAVAHYHRSTDELMRPDLSTPEAMRGLLDLLVLEPRLAQLARDRGYDRDSSTVGLIDLKREEVAVEHLFQDSIEAKVFVPPAQRRKYYADNEHRFYTEPSIRYGMFYLRSKQETDELAARLKGGVQLEQIIREDEDAGRGRGKIEVQTANEAARPFHRILFDEMRPGEVRLIGPDDKGGYNLLYIASRDEGGKVPFELADRQIDEYLTQEAANSLLAAFTERHGKRMRIESHPELLMRIDLRPPGN